MPKLLVTYGRISSVYAQNLPGHSTNIDLDNSRDDWILKMGTWPSLYLVTQIQRCFVPGRINDLKRIKNKIKMVVCTCWHDIIVVFFLFLGAYYCNSNLARSLIYGIHLNPSINFGYRSSTISFINIDIGLLDDNKPLIFSCVLVPYSTRKCSSNKMWERKPLQSVLNFDEVLFPWRS